MDLETLVLANFVLMAFAAAALWFFRRAYPTTSSIGWMACCATSMAVGVALIGLAAPFGSHARSQGLVLGLGNGLLVLGLVALNRGIADYWGCPRPRMWLHASFVAAVTGAYLHFSTRIEPGAPHLGPRAMIVGGAMALELGLGGWMFEQQGARPAALAMGGFALFNLVRGPITWRVQLQPRYEHWVLAATDYGFLIFSVLVSLALVWMVIVDLRTRLGHLARTDALTGLLNRRALEAEGARRRGSALLVMDVDRFKELNDRHGHAAGDEALRAISGCLRRALGAGDLAARLGGEEFVILLEGQELAAALAMAESLRVCVETLQFRFERRPIPLTASFGVAVPGSGAETWVEVLHRADQALYEAKQQGRNRVCSARPSCDMVRP